ncbi:MAG: L-arabinose isomerase family protein, partial [Planctomycetota bacterium]
MFKAVGKPKVAVIGLSLEFYRNNLPEFIKRLNVQMDKFQQEITAYTDIINSTLCCAESEIQQAIKSAEESDIDALLVIPMSYTASLMSVPSLAETDLPIIIWNTQEAETITESYDSDDLLMNHIPQGTQDVTNVLLRHNKIFGMESGHYKDKKALEKLSDWLEAARAFRAADIRAGILGKPFDGMGDFGFDEKVMSEKWGPTVVKVSLADFAEKLQKVSDKEAEAVLEKDREIYDIADNLDEETHIESIKMELALREIVREENLASFTMNFSELIEDKNFSTMPFLGINKLMAEGMGYGGEGDVMTAALMAQMRTLCGAATFTEIYTIDYKNNRMMMTHMQECSSAMARKDRKVRLINKEFWAPGVKPYAGMHFTLEPGPVTLCAMTPDNESSFRLITHEAEISNIAPLENFDIPHWLAIPGKPVSDFLTAYSMAGGPHHLTAVPGHM